MDKQIQYFQIANLIFSKPYNQVTDLKYDEILKIKSRFQNIIDSFLNMENTQYATNNIKKGGTNLPYNSKTIIGEINNHIILHFTFTYKEPILFVVDTKDNKVKNYINIENAKNILDDEIFQDIKDELFYPKNLDRLFKGIDDINNFVKDFEILLHKYNNIDTLTGRDCFEVSLEEFGDR